MTDIEAFTADRILRIPDDEPERLFRRDSLKADYHALAMRWHPDRAKEPNATAVFARISELYEAAARKDEDGTWMPPGQLVLSTTAGKQVTVHYMKRRPFELGDMYICRTSVWFVVPNDWADLAHNFRRATSRFEYPSERTRKNTARCMPTVMKQFETRDGKCVIAVSKTDEVILLDDLLAHVGGKLDPRHVAWIVSELHHICCYLDWSKRTHNAISLDTLFVSPPHHGVAVLGGWWYAKEQGSQMPALPNRIRALAPSDILASKQANPRLDLSLIRDVATRLLGADNPAKLLMDKALPRPLVNWCRMPSSGIAARDYEIWQKAREDSFGARRFAKLEVKACDIYDM
jgi:hypothetical protein